MNHVYIDLTTLARWRGTLTGIQRCQKIYASHALEHVPNVRFTLFDPVGLCYRHLSTSHAKRILEGNLRADMMVMPDINQHRVHFVDRLPVALRPAYWWLTKTRRMTASWLEGIRFSYPDKPAGRLAARLQHYLIKSRDRSNYELPGAGRIDRPQFGVLAGKPVQFLPEDVVIAMQNDWAHTDIEAIAGRKRNTSWRHVILCHDLIPILFPHWYDAPDVNGFISYYDRAFSIADRVIFTSQRTLMDAQDYCAKKNIALAAGPVVPMGGDFQTAAELPPLPGALKPGKFALFVSTIEPRKNHAMLVEAWRKLVVSGLIGQTGFKLVFAGKFGWHMEDFLRELGENELTRDSVLHISGADDGLISRLYEDAAFCLYPPLYEGFGLPIVEALSRGKALISSSAGPMAEIAGDFAIRLDPADTDGWMHAMADWIGNPHKAQQYAMRTRHDYRPVSWDESAQRFFEAALAPFNSG